MVNPPHFLWGAATSSHQVEGNNTASDWWAWEQQSKVKQPSGIACDHYRLYPQDFELISRLGHNAHRFSLEWSRFEPQENHWNEEAFLHYEKVFKELKARGIEPVVTLHHFTNPQWFTDKGGWLSPDSIDTFSRYVRKVIAAYSPYVRFWITINEPLVYIYHGYSTGLWPPGIQSFRHCLTVFRHLLKAHIEAYRVIHSIYQDIHKEVWVSVAQHMTDLVPCRPQSIQDQVAVYLRRWFANHLFLDAAITGFLFFPGVFCEFLQARNTLDFIGVNYYTRNFIRWDIGSVKDSLGISCEAEHHADQVKERNDMGWQVCPEGLYSVLRELKKYQLPVLVAENGICTQDDKQRAKFIEDHLRVVDQARKAGVPVFGYLYWSSLDNFEWDSGFGPRFGIIEVNYETQERKVKDSAQVLTEYCRKLFSREGG